MPWCLGGKKQKEINSVCVRSVMREARTDILRSRVNLLAGKDKALMTMYLDNGGSFRQMARLTGVNEVTVARKIRSLSARLADGKYITCLRNRNRFSKMELSIAKDYLLSGLSIRKIAEARHSTVYSIRKTIKKIQNVLKGQSRNTRCEK